jgi:hypothetical protein
MAFTTYLANRVLEHIVGKTAFTMPTVHVGLMKADPTAAGTQTSECVYGGYARIATTGSTWGTAASSTVSNAASMTFGSKVSGADEVATHWATFDAATGGNMLSYGPLVSSASIVNGSAPTVSIGNAPQSLS